MGHHSGLHPEDQPYQSSLMPVAPSASGRTGTIDSEQPRAAQKEPEKIILLPAGAQSPTPPAPSRLVLPPPSPLPPSPVRWASYLPLKPGPQRRVIPTFLILTCLLLLLTASFVAYMFISKKPEPSAAMAALTATPAQLRMGDTFKLAGNGFGANDAINFTRDLRVTVTNDSGQPLRVHADGAGAFEVQVSVTATWVPGQHRLYAADEKQLLSVSTTIIIAKPSAAPPRLRLSDKQVDLGADIPGAITRESITLGNSGGSMLTWQASSNQAWLTIAPGSGTFSGSSVVSIIVNRGTLMPQIYSGAITFSQQGSGDTQILAVRMIVKAAPGTLSVLPASLSYSASTGQNPPAQAITIQNGGGQPLDWSSAVTTGNGAAWLSISPASGHLDPGASATVSVSMQVQQLAVGVYQGAINFQGGVNQQVSVSLSIVAPGNLVVSPPSLNFSATVGQGSGAQSITLQNSGGQPLDWSARASTNSGGTWLTPSPASGHLKAGAKVPVNVSASAALLTPGSYQGTVTLTYGASMKKVPVALTVSPPPVPAIGLSASSMTFTTPYGINPDAQ
ncbi:MAG: choice-of-anchor D domain-containing protein, partial [Chloroflexota bacterium]|nr:choice-of-anchor D domain-containing protein [Chloroflexota bacterium]